MIRLSQPIITDEEINEINNVLRSGMLVQGKHVELFEKSLNEYIGIPFTLAVSSGTAALHLALAALNIKEGDAVFIPAFTFPATANVIEIQRARPVLVDVELKSYNMDPSKLEHAILNWKGPEKPRAIIVVHEFGAPCRMDEIMRIARRYGLFVIEDAACALGTTFQGQHIGTFGDIGCFSWHPRKAITTGEGGALVIKDEEIYHRVKLLRNHGIDRDEYGNVDFLLAGFNYRLTEFQAVLGTMQLRNFSQWLEIRKVLVDVYLHELKEIQELRLPSKIQGHAWQTFMILLPETVERKQVIDHLRNQEIESNLGAQAIHMLTYYKGKYGYKSKDFPVARDLFLRGLALPLYAGLHAEDIKKVTTSLKDILFAN